MAYKKILVAVDLGETSAGVIDKAHKLALGQGAQIHVLHAVEPLSITYGGDIPMDFSSIQDEIYEQARDQLSRLCAAKAIPESQRHLVVGRPENEIAATCVRPKRRSHCCGQPCAVWLSAASRVDCGWRPASRQMRCARSARCRT